MRESNLENQAQASSSPARKPETFPSWVLFGLLFVLTIGVFWPVRHFDFINFDDPIYISDNTRVQAGLSWDSFKWAFSHQVCALWHPLTVLSLMADCQFFGGKPGASHLMNLLLHAFNVTLVFALLRRITGAKWRSFVVAVLFAVLPVNVESVAWISERKNVLSTFFGLLSLIFYCRYAIGRVSVTAERSGTGALTILARCFQSPAWWLAFLFLTLGLLSKAMLVTWPFVMLLLDYWPLERFQSRNLWPLMFEKIPLLALVPAACAAAVLAGKSGGSVVGLNTMSMTARFENVPVSYCRYLGKIFWPSNLCIFYPLPASWPVALVMLSALFLVGVTVAVWMMRRRFPCFLMSWLWFIGILVPMVGFVQLGGQSIGDRYVYVPGIGILTAVIWGLSDWMRQWRSGGVVLSFLASAVVVLSLVLTRLQLPHWRNSEAAFRRAVAVTVNNAVAHEYLGDAIYDDNKNNDPRRNDEAIREFREAIRINPNYPGPHNNLALALEKKGDWNEAITEFERSVFLDPHNGGTRFNLGVALAHQGRNEEAVAQFREACRAKPGDVMAAYTLGTALGMIGRIDEAIEQFQAVLRLDPNYADARNNLGNALFYKGRIDEAVTQFREAIRLQPNQASTYNNLAMALEKKGSLDDAIVQLREAVRLAPDYFEARCNLGDALYHSGHPNDAISEFQTALKLRPGDPLAQRKLNFLVNAKTQSTNPSGH